MSLSDILTRANANGLASLKMVELRQIATAQGMKGTSGMRKGDLVAAIEAGGRDQRPQRAQQGENDQRSGGHEDTRPRQRGDHDDQNRGDQKREHRNRDDQNRGDRNHDNSKTDRDRTDRNGEGDQGRENANDRGRDRDGDHKDRSGDADSDQHDDHHDRGHGRHGEGRRGRRNRRNRRNRGDRGDRNPRNNDRGDRGHRRGRNNAQDDNNQGGDNQGHNNQGNDQPEQLVPVAGILDFADANTAFIRTTGYHAGTTDVYVPVNTARKHGMRHGDAITGFIRPRNNNGNNHGGGRGRNRQKYTPIHSVETVNGLTPDQAAQRPHFSKLTPLYPNQRLRLETEPKVLTTRVIDLIMPIGKGQRALIVSPPKAGKTTILQDIANAISANNPECYLMVVLVDERPEEVTDMQRSVNGEVIASTFDRPPGEHTAVAELAVERAKRLVEQGKDVVLLLDSITRLGRAYNNSSPASGRILSGGVDSNALYPPKRFLGAARNIENGGSLTIIATAMVETGSAGDTVIFEEFKGTGNAELKLDRRIAERRVFPAVDVNPSGTRKDELLLAPEEARLMLKLRRILAALEPQAAIDLLIKQLKKSKTNREFMMQIASSAPLAGDEDED